MRMLPTRRKVLSFAAAGCLAGRFDGLVTGPVHKANINAGGIAYTAGTAFYLRPHARWSHAIWHLFVIVGSLCHYVAVMRHLL